ncbi:hypothetical protein BgiBS90_014060 [Biomphalaria glabrata]|nr:hypothetical protein BgiBS90_014060 [Biomphalaria glabrata]
MIDLSKSQLTLLKLMFCFVDTSSLNVHVLKCTATLIDPRDCNWSSQFRFKTRSVKTKTTTLGAVFTPVLSLYVQSLFGFFVTRRKQNIEKQEREIDRHRPSKTGVKERERGREIDRHRPSKTGVKERERGREIDRHRPSKTGVKERERGREIDRHRPSKTGVKERERGREIDRHRPSKTGVKERERGREIDRHRPSKTGVKERERERERKRDRQT